MLRLHHRAGMGLRPEDDPTAPLVAQLAGGGPQIAGLPSAAELVAAQGFLRKKGKDALLRWRRQVLLKERRARLWAAVGTGRPVAERLVRFWSNHLTVSVERKVVMPYAGAFEREVVRASLAGPYEQMLLRSAQHPAMLLYLDQVRSVGPDSAVGRRKGKGLNENLARELLELHSLGVEGGYEQADVEGLAALLTGWTVAYGAGDDAEEEAEPGESDGSAFAFSHRRHQPGVKRLLGREYGEGRAAGEQALRDLARHPATARRCCRALLLHFEGEEPGESRLSALCEVWARSGGDLPAVHAALLEGLRCAGPRLRRPSELSVAALRAVGGPPPPEAWVDQLIALEAAMGEPALSAPSPKGWSERVADWSGPEQVLARLSWAADLGELLAAEGRNWGEAAPGLLGAAPAPDVQTAISSAGSAGRAWALLLASPEAQWR